MNDPALTHKDGSSVNKDFIDKMLHMVMQSLEAPDKFSKIACCDTFSSDDFRKYIKGLMPEEKMHGFEAHCLSCKSCLQGVLEALQTDAIEINSAENDYLFQNTTALLDKLDQPSPETILEIVVNVAKDVIDIIKTSGDILAGPAPSAVRGTDQNNTRPRPVKIIKEIDDPAVSVQVSFCRQSNNDHMVITLSFLNRDSDEFISGIDLTCHGCDTPMKMTTDSLGQATMTIEPLPCKWTIDCSIADETITTLNLTFEGY